MLGREKRNSNEVTVKPVSSFTSRMTVSSDVSPMSLKPPGRSSVPLAGSRPRLTTSTRPLLSKIKAAVAADGFMNNSKLHDAHFLLFSEDDMKDAEPHKGQYLNLSKGWDIICLDIKTCF